MDLSGPGKPTVAAHAVERQEQHLRVADNAASRTIATILRHDAKVTSYKLALIRAVNDVVLSFPDAGSHDQPIAIPLRVLAEYWLAYYWPFADPRAPISQGPRSLRNGTLANDMAFRPALAALWQVWQEVVGETVRPSDGFFLINEFGVARRREGYPLTLRRAFGLAVSTVARSIEQPIHYAGPGEWGVFSRPVAFAALADRAIGIPGTTATDRCVVVSRDLWDGFLDLSLWVEALSIHEWALFTESVTQPGGVVVRRGEVYTLLTDRPDNRRPLDWERNQIDLLLMEGHSRPPRGSSSRISTTTLRGSLAPLSSGMWLRGLHARAHHLVLGKSRQLLSISWTAPLRRATWRDSRRDDRMTRKEYDKLVRDLIPDIIRQYGSTCGVERLDGDEAFRGALRAKLIEEAREAAEAPDAELATESADLLEVVDGIVEAYGLTSETVRALQQERRAERGGFAKRVRLLWTNDSPE